MKVQTHDKLQASSIFITHCKDRSTQMETEFSPPKNPMNMHHASTLLPMYIARSIALRLFMS